MVRIRTVQIRLTRDQYDKIKHYSKVRGFSTLSSYMRYVALDQAMFLEQKLREMLTSIWGTQKKK